MDNKADTVEVKKCVKERPILFSGPMVRAILDGLKTQTRRIVKIKNRDLYSESTFLHGGCAAVALGLGAGSITDFREQEGSWFGLSGYTTVVCIDRPYIRIGGQLWVRETFQIASNYHVDCRDTKPPFDDGRPVLRIDDPCYPYWEQCYYAATDTCPELISVDTDEIEQKWRPSIHMPRWASRITLEVTGVRVERLQDISEADAMAEGCDPYMPGEGIIERPIAPDEHQYRPDYTTGFRSLWESINGPGSWNANPWVWVVEFRRLP